VGDPSCDLAVAWTLLSAEGRRVLRDRLAVEDGAWARGRGWALWKALASSAQAVEEPAGSRAGAAQDLDPVLATVLDDRACGW
jgi:aminoglycoside phosphotransferase (APT) family kinase protein